MRPIDYLILGLILAAVAIVVAVILMAIAQYNR